MITRSSSPVVGLSNFWLFWYQKSVQIFIFFSKKVSKINFFFNQKSLPNSFFLPKKCENIFFYQQKSVQKYFFISKKVSKNIFFNQKCLSNLFFKTKKCKILFFFTFFFKIDRTFENIYEFISNILFKIVVNDLIHNLSMGIYPHICIVTSLRLLGPCQVKKVNSNLLIPSRRDC